MHFGKILLASAVVVAVLVTCGAVGAYYFLRRRSYEWHEITSSDNKFRVSFPSKASLLETNEKSTDGRPFVSHTLKSSPADRVVYSVNWWENPTQKNLTAQDLFAMVRQTDVNVFHARVSNEKDLKIQGCPAKLIFVMAGNGVTVENLAVRAGDRVYSLWVVESEAMREKENIQKFFGSFKLQN